MVWSAGERGPVVPMYRKNVIKPWQLVLLGLPLVIAGVGTPAVMMPSALADERAYTAAPQCPVGTPPEAPGDCLSRRNATVLGKDTTGGGKYKRYYLVLGFADGSQQRVRLQSGVSNQKKVEQGEPVTVTGWRHEIREITTRDDELLTTTAYPVSSYLPLMLVAVSLTPLGGSVLWMAYWVRRLRRTGRSIESVGRWHTSVPFVTAMLYAIVAVAAVVASPTPAVGAAAAGVAAAGAVLIAALRWRGERAKAERRAAALLAGVQVGVPVTELLLPARVLGDVPYSREDCDHLVVGPAGLAATPDPRGMAGRIPLPASLAFVRLHARVALAPRTTGLVRPLFVECRDGDREVLIAADRDHVPWILGALRAQPQRVGY
ncbi:hypothetical protein [Streptomyces sp. DSM 40750]|uniref:hypothetical protein n=1 Tax=Streptomyces sp. DSM 40750 TaxID=2801030 RepID=UPI00214C0C0F|nr:hypothetical protein [Streptomyces sp. DSM 40750]UUU19614.1 hypothetical protein JIX55_04420 [Streptomyces sp. DSM 40750]UUU27044.1 hypothetical protein JIX55_46330 [Streptomyces sp. DSM 40750]